MKKKENSELEKKSRGQKATIYFADIKSIIDSYSREIIKTPEPCVEYWNGRQDAAIFILHSIKKLFNNIEKLKEG